MIVVGITGGIGSGKSIACNIFKTLDVPVFDADSEAKKLYDLPDVLKEIRIKIGDEVFNKKGDLDKGKLAELIFNDSKALKKVNRIIHPLVNKKFIEWKEQQKSIPYVMKEAAILFESGSHSLCDKIITVVAPSELRIKRIMERDKRTKEQVEQIISRQWSDEEKIKRSDFVIVNDEKKMLLPQVIEINKKILGGL